MPLLASQVPNIRHALGLAYVGASAGASYGISGTFVLTAVGTVVAVITLVLLVISGNRKTRREVAKDIADAYEKGQQDRDEQLQPFIDLWKSIAKGELRLAPGQPLPEPPAPSPTPGGGNDD